MTDHPVQKLNEALVRAEKHAPYLRLLMARFPDVTAQISSGNLPQLDPLIDASLPVASALRVAKAKQALCLAIGDLAGQLPVDAVTGHLSSFADRSLDVAIAAAIEAHVPGAESQGFAAIALGKHGGKELNYSSDIDPIFLFDPETLPRRAREEPAEAAVRTGRRVLDLMQARDGDGYVFRVDLRLRPNPEVTPIVLPVDAAISYYESSALPWERAAFIRARACSGDLAVGRYFLDAIRPFVWRRGIDFGARHEIRAMTHRIRDHYARGQAFGPGFDLKRGRGGIREVEFFAQIHQLIHGGRDATLRSACTPEALRALTAAGWIARDVSDPLIEAYTLFRTIEHRLQMVDDLQTHQLPADGTALDNIARLHGLENGDALLSVLKPHIDFVGAQYDGLDGEEEIGLPQDNARLAEALSRSGIAEATFLAERVAHWRSGRVRSLRTPAAQAAFEAVLPQLTKAMSTAPDPRTAIIKLDGLIERLPSAINLFRLLEARPQLFEVMLNVLCLAPTLAEEMARRTELLDGLIDATAFDLPGSVDVLAARFSHDDPEADIEQRLDRVRREVGEKRFALGVQIIEAISDPLDVAAGYARVAEAAIRVVSDAVRHEFERQHGRVPGSDLIILALGRMGGAELTHASDLDLIYLFSGDFAAMSDGPKPLGAVQYYNRLAQRVTAGLSVATAAGPLYEVDTRLRPSGADGPLAVSLEGFAKYQLEDAWTWEHMALCRARVVYGDATEVDRIIAAVLNAKRDRSNLLADAGKMRADMATHKPPKGVLDVKLGSGGLVDLEFCVHVMQLARGVGLSPQLGTAIAALASADLLPADMAEAHAFLTRVLVTLRLVAPTLEVPDAATQALIARACGAENWDDLLAALATVRQGVSRAWEEILTGDKTT
jgi:[glutamine synthetase] adenylyltransferase / [glutamine synthetase]-adenylyl-L-tyrosine phosphorylase